VRVSREENVFPMVPAGGALQDIFLDEQTARASLAAPAPVAVGDSGAGEMS